MSSDFTPRGYHPPVKKKEAACTGCRTCELMCPDLAIFVEEAPLEVQEAKTAKKKRRGGK